MSGGRISKPVLHNGEVFDKIYLSRKQLYDKFGYCGQFVNKLVDKGDILRFEIRDREIFIVKNEFQEYLLSDTKILEIKKEKEIINSQLNYLKEKEEKRLEKLRIKRQKLKKQFLKN